MQKARLELDVKRNRAHQDATLLISWLRDRGCIAPACSREAVHVLAEEFYKHGVEITTEEQRKLLSK